MTTKTQAVLIGCRDDKSIIKRMKTLGIWKKMQSMSKPGEAVSMINYDELFIWHGEPGDSGYSYFTSTNLAELLRLSVELFGPMTAANRTRH